MQLNSAVTRSSEAILHTNKLIKNTYMLLSMTLIFSGFTAFLSIAMQVSHGIAFASTLIGIGLLWLYCRERKTLPRASPQSLLLPVC